MDKYILDLAFIETPDKAQEYISLALEFPDYYGKNLDALYDCLTERNTDYCIGLFLPSEHVHPLYEYGRKLVKVFKDAAEENEHLCVIFGEIEDNYGGEDD